jgi:hypothetical protein
MVAEEAELVVVVEAGRAELVGQVGVEQAEPVVVVEVELVE